MGANITIVARNVDMLKLAETEIQVFHLPSLHYSFFLHFTRSIEKNLGAPDSIQFHGKVPEYVFTCAGTSYPGLFVEQDIQIFETSMQLNYFGSLYTVHGLAESLRNELLAYGINVSLYLPGTILSPGLQKENLMKPEITKELEGAEDGLTPEQCADALVSGN
ncbi:hypothetical protein AYI68_g4829 [Smittium mucronatum]|uniref:Uncharacterized protein n=1 Tax=Smittium mucronatum TaxID=133383 RepID=A0A1R0GW11_9FUNG|nr:hypothetical protein AYI68_g4829 [Smittium mucronatum]